MELAGTLSENLRAALTSCKRLRAQPVYGDTVEYWQELLKFARLKAGRPSFGNLEELNFLIAELQAELTARENDPASREPKEIAAGK